MVTNKEKNFISCVLYIHDCEEQLKTNLPVIYDILNGNFEKFEFVCVNDCSSDRGVEVIKDFAAGVSNCVFSLINTSIYQGVELSMVAGVDFSIGDFVFEFDDIRMDYPAETVMNVYHRLLSGYDIVSASPEKASGFFSYWFYRIFNSHSGNANKLRTERFRLISRRAINRVHSINSTVAYRKAVYASSGLKMDAIIYPVDGGGRAKYGRETLKVRENTAFDSLILFTDVAYRISVWLTGFLLAFTVFTGVYTLAVYLGRGNPVPGWTTTMLVLSFSFFGVFLVLAIIIKYLSVLVDLVFKKQKYLIESIEKISNKR